MKSLVQGYINHSKAVGALYCIIPSVSWFASMMALVEFREIYLLRLGLAVVAGGAMAAFVNAYGVRMWLVKHRSADGPATILDGAAIGAAVGFGIALLPPLTSLIGTNHPEEAKLFIIGAWAITTFNGAVIGAVLSAIGIKHVDRARPAGSGEAPRS